MLGPGRAERCAVQKVPKYPSPPYTHTPAGREECMESEGSLDWVLGQLSPLLGLSALGKLHALFHSEAAWERAGALSGKQA